MSMNQPHRDRHADDGSTVALGYSRSGSGLPVVLLHGYCGIGHMSMVEAPSACAREMLDFLTSDRGDTHV